jgi:hypothetical protein
VESDEDFHQAPNATHVMADILPIAPFNYWTPGWFWEIGLVVIVVFGIGTLEHCVWRGFLDIELLLLSI